MKNKRGNVLVIFLAVALIVSMAAIGYFFIQNKQLQNQTVKPISPVQNSAPTNNFPTPTPVSTPAPTVDQMTNWKIYTDPHNIFTIKHPNFLKEEPKIVVQNIPGAQQPTKEEMDKFSGVFYNTISNGNTGETGELHVTFYNYKAKQGTQENIKDFIFRVTNYSFSNLQEITVDGQKSWFGLAVWRGGGVAELGAWIPKNSGTYILVLLDTSEGGLVGGISKEHTDLFKQMLTTFKFL